MLNPPTGLPSKNFYLKVLEAVISNVELLEVGEGLQPLDVAQPVGLDTQDLQVGQAG